MQHTLKISILKESKSGGIINCRNVTLRERVLCRLFGKKEKMMILIPGDSVESLSIKEISEQGGAEHDPEPAADKCCS